MVHLNGKAWPEHTHGIDSTPSLSSHETTSSALFEDLQSLNSERISRRDHRDLKSRDHRSPRDLGQIDDPTSIISSAPSPMRPSRNAAALGPRPLLPRSLKEALQLAELLSKSKLIPKGFETPETCLVGILYGMEVGLSPIAALQRMAVIDGRPTIWGDAALALVQASGLLQSIEEEIVEKEETDNRKILTAICKVKREGRFEPTIGAFSVEDAKRAGLWQKPGPWTDYPKRMLTMRARSFALRDAFPDVLAGLYIREEFEGAANKDNRQRVRREAPGQTEDQVHDAQDCHHDKRDSDFGQTNPNQFNDPRGLSQPRVEKTANGSLRRAPPAPPPPPPPPPDEMDNANLDIAASLPSSADDIEALASMHEDEPRPLDPETLLDLFDSALCCALDLPTLEEIIDEFAERLKRSSREIQDRAQRIIERHWNRIDELDRFKGAREPEGFGGAPEHGEINTEQAPSETGSAESKELPRGLRALLPYLGLGSAQRLRRQQKKQSRQARSLAFWNSRQRLQALEFKTTTLTELEYRDEQEREL